MVLFRSTPGVVGQSGQPLVLPVAPTVYIGSKRLSTYSGAFGIDAAGNDIPFNSGGNNLLNPSVTAIQRAYDQSGNGYVFNQVTSANQPSITPLWNMGGCSPITFDGRPLIAPTTGKWLNVDASLSLSRRAFSVFMVAFPRVSLTNHGFWEFNNGVTTTYANLQTTPSNAGVTQAGAVAADSGVRPRANPSVIGYVGSAASQTFYLNETSIVGAVNFAQTMTGGGFLGRTLSNLGRFDCYAYVVYNTALTPTQANETIAALQAAFNIPTTFSKRIILDGDSLTEGAAILANLNQDTWAQARLYTQYECFNLGIGGQTMADCVSNFSTRTQLLYTASMPCVLLNEAGTNSIQANVTAANLYGSSAASASSAWKYVSDAKAAGFRTGITTVLPRATFTSGRLTEWNAYNPLVRTNAAAADFIVDYQADPTIGPIAAASDVNFYFDGTHGTPAMYQARAAIQRAALLAA